ncbi:MAG: LamG-like jellyroll fold domain-containing protein, partial [Bacteroidota bacterium]
MKIVALFLFHSLLYINSGLRASAINDAVSISAIQMGPTVVCQPDTIEVNNRSACLGIVFAEDFDNGSTGEQLTFSLNPEGPFPPGTSDVYLIATDINGVKDSCLTTITVIDPPDLRLNSPTIFLNASGNASIDPLELVDLSNTTTECGNALVISDLTVSQTNFNCNDVGSGTALSFDGSFLMKSKPDSLNLSNRILTSDSLEISFLFRTEQQERAFLLSRMANPGGIAGPERFNYLVWIEDGNLAFLTMHNLLSNPDLISINSAVLDNELSDFHFKVNDGKWYQVRITMRVESNVTKAVLFVEEYGSSDPFRRNSASSSGSQFEFYIEPDRDGASPYLFYLGGVHEFNNERFIGDIDDLRIVSYGREVLYHDFEQTNESKASAITDKSLSDIHYDGIPSDFTLVPDVSSSKQVMVTITDQDGITDSAMTFVTVLDSIYTTFLAEGQQLILDENGQGSILLGSIDTTSFDACGVRSIRFVDLGQSTLTIRDTLISAECSDLGAQTVGVIATDVNSNQDTASITIEVLENTFLNTINHIAVLEENDSVFVAPNDFVSRDPFTSCVGTGGVTDLTMINQSVYTCDDLINTGGMIRFDGIDDQISIEESSDLVLDGSITLEAWIRTTKDSGIQQVITKPAGGDPASYSLNLQNGLPTISIYALGFPESQPAGMGSTVVSDGLWHHLAGVFDHEHDSIFLYVDGILQVAALIQSRSRFVGNDGLFIGNFSEFTDQHFEGDIDEIRIWNVPRTADEISRNFTVPLQGDEPGLIAYYNFDEVPGTSQAFDGTDGGNNGRLTNMESVSARQNRYLGFEKIILNAESSGANTSDTVFLILQDTITGNCVGKQEVTGRIGIDCNENLQGFAYSFDDPDRDVEDPVRELHFNDVPVNLFREGITLEAWVKTSGRAFMPGNFGFGQKFHLLSIDHITSQEVARELRLMLDPTSGFTAEYIGDFLPNFSLLTQEEPVFDGLDRLPLHYDEQWHHTAVTLNRNRMSFYVDGVLIRSFNINVPAGGIFPSGIPIRVISGRKSIATIQNVVPNLYSSAEELYTGNDTDAQIDELRVWSSARTPQEIFENYNVSLIGDEPNLELYVNFEEPAGEISDLSRNNFTGSLINQGISDGMPVPFADPSDWVTRSTPGLQNATVQFVLDQDGSVTFDSDLFAFNCPTEQIVESLSTNSFDCDDLNVRENAIGLNGSNAFGFVEENSVMDLQQSFTTSGWVRATNSTGIQRLFVKIRGSAQNYSLLLRDGVPEAVYNGAEGTVDVFARGTERIDDGLWHFISAVRSAETNTFSLYVDAELVTRVDGSVTPDNGDQGFFIGNAGLFGQYLNGELDDISIWETTRNEEELLAEMRSGPDTSDPDLVAHYGFEDAEGLANAVLIDESDNSLSGTLTDYVVPSVTARRSIGIQELSVNTRDANNNLLDYQVTAIIQDTIPPLVNVQFVTVFLGEDGTVTLSSDDFVQSAQDSCDSLNYFFSQPVLTCEDLGSNQIDLVAEDQGGNQVNAVFTVVVADTITAVLEIEDQMLALGESDQVVVPFDDLIPERVDCRITDYTLELVSGTVTIDNDLDLVIYSCTDVGVNEILVRGADYRLTEVTTTFTITVSPELHVTPQTLVIDELGNASINSTDFEPFGRVGCSTEPVTLQILNDSIFDCSHLNMISGAVSFLESDDVITIEENDSLDLSESFTLEAWFRTTEGSGFTRILRKPTANGRQNYSLLLQDGVPSVYYDRQPSGVVRADGLGPINDGLWHHIAGVRDGTQDSLKLYIDGVQVSSVYVAGLLPLQGNEGLFIGNGGVGQSQQLIGDIDALRIWERVLSASEIRQNQFRTLSGNEPGLVAAYDFEEAFLPNPQLDLNQLQAVSELTGNHDGTFTNANFNNRNANRAIGRQEVVLQGGTPTSTVMRDTTFVLLQDTSSVVITYVSDLEFTLDPAGNLTLEVEDLVADVSDNCEITQVLLNQNQFDCSHVGGINVGLTAIGPQGQLHREEVLITIQENDNPDLLVIPDTVNLVLIDGQSRAVTEADFGISGGPCGTLEVEDLTFSCADIENELFEIRATFNPLTGANQVLAIPARVSNVSTTIETFNLNISLYENTPDQLSSSVLYDSTVFTCSEPLDNDLLRIENQLLLSCDALNFT